MRLSQVVVVGAASALAAGFLALPAQGVEARKSAGVRLRPTPSAAFDDRPIVYHTGKPCHQDNNINRGPLMCQIGKSGGKTRVLAVGDSHMAEWSSVLRRIAAQRNWRVDWLSRSGCPVADVRIPESDEPPNSPPSFIDCGEWRDQALEMIQKKPKYDLIIATDAYYGQPGRKQQIAGLRRSLQVLSASATRVAWMFDTPKQTKEPQICAEQVLKHSSGKRGSSLVNLINQRCAARTKIATRERTWDMDRASMKGLANVYPVNLNKLLCPERPRCLVVTGRIFKWRDANHITATYANTQAGPFKNLILPILNKPPVPPS